MRMLLYSMHIPEYSLSPAATASLDAAFRPFATRMIDGMTLPEWLARQEYQAGQKQFLDISLAMELAATFQNVLALEHGPEGLQLLDAFDGIIHGGGNPAMLIHGLPAAPEVASIVREAMRLSMGSNLQHPFTMHMSLKDEHSLFSPTGYVRGSFSSLHQDTADIVMMHGANGGNNPRHTPVVTFTELCERIAARTQQSAHPVSADRVCALFRLPVWPVGAGPFEWRATNKSYNACIKAMQEEEAVAQDQLRTVKGKMYAPILIQNPAWNEREQDSQPYRLLPAPFVRLYHRLKPNMTKLPADMKEDLVACLPSMREALKLKKDVMQKEGPVLQAGDALVINNRLLLHAGGPPVHDYLPWRQRLTRDETTWREIVVLDGHPPKDRPYPIRPGDRFARPIRIGSGVGIDATTFER